MTNEPLTITGQDGLTVLAKLYKGEPYAVTYANRTQAERKQKQLGTPWYVYRGTGRAFLVVKCPPSPEETGRYECSCGNTTEFTGIDKHGYPGDDCECGQDECVCQVELQQDFNVTRLVRAVNSAADVDIDYHAFTGGGCGAEIGSYTTIDCRVCLNSIWEDLADV